MSPTYRVTLIQLTADASALAPAGDKVELGNIPIEDVCQLAERLLRLDLSAATKAEPGIIVQRGDKGWRIAIQQGRLRVHKSMSLFDDFWLAETAADIAHLPPFRSNENVESAGTTRHAPSKSGRFQAVRTIGEIAGLFIAALVLIAVGLRFGLPQQKLSDLPPGVVLVTNEPDRASVFGTISGIYAAGKKHGDSILIISPDGQVSLGSFGKDGKPMAPRFQEQARAGRQGDIACLITSFGNIYGTSPPDVVNLGGRQPLKRTTIALQ